MNKFVDQNLQFLIANINSDFSAIMYLIILRGVDLFVVVQQFVYREDTVKK